MTAGTPPSGEIWVGDEHHLPHLTHIGPFEDDDWGCEDEERMIMPVSQQNPDGSWSPATPLDYQPVPGGDWEVYGPAATAARHVPRRHHAVLFDGDTTLAIVIARTRLGLTRRMRREMARRG